MQAERAADYTPVQSAEQSSQKVTFQVDNADIPELPEPTTKSYALVSSILADDNPLLYSHLVDINIGDTTYVFVEYSLFVFHSTNPIRVYLMWLIVQPIFQNGIMMCVILNSVLYAISDYSKVLADGSLDTRYQISMRNYILAGCDDVFVMVFVLECGFKLIGMGAIGVKNRGGYFSDYWNWLDFCVVVTGLISLFPGMGNSANSIRAFRAFRPLRNINSLPGLKALVTAVLAAVPQLVNVLALLVLTFFLFAVGGIVIFQNADQHKRCRLTPYPVKRNWVPGLDYKQVYF